jgi:hypothetical protein
MKKTVLLIAFAFCLFSFQGFSNPATDSTNNKNAFTVSADRTSYQNPLNLSYARKISQKSWLKFGLGFVGDYTKNNPTTSLSFPTRNLYIRTTFSLGLDRHHTLKSSLEIVYGLNLRLISETDFYRVENPGLPVEHQRNTTFNFLYGLGGELGLYYKISDNFSVGSSINPVILYTDDTSSSNTIRSIHVNLTNVSIVRLRYEF